MFDKDGITDAMTAGSFLGNGNRSDDIQDSSSSLLNRDNYLRTYTVENEVRTMRQRLAESKEQNRRLKIECTDALEDAERDMAMVYVEKRRRGRRWHENWRRRTVVESKKERRRGSDGSQS